MSIYFATFSFISLIVTFYYETILHTWSKSPENTILAIGILSSRENFLQRAAARFTWLKEFSSSGDDVRAWFLVGSKSCDVPPDYRLSIHGCEKWNINVSGLQEKFYTSYEMHPSLCSLDSGTIFHQGFSFKVNYPVVVTKLGILTHLLLDNISIKVAIMDIQSKEVVVQAVISRNHTNVNGFSYAEVDAILLPKGYEGLIIVAGYLKDTACADVVWNDGGGIITFERIYSSQHLNSKKYSPDMFAAASIMFFVPEIDKLKIIVDEEVSVTKQWFQHLEESNKRLKNEIEEKKDILVVDVTDTYRSLPTKLLKFYKWLNVNYEFSYIMKTDDDSLIDIPRLLEKLKTDSRFDPERLWLWSRFRKDWPVNYIGKWADYDYQSSYYPSFPCGAAYIMSRQVATWLISNAEALHAYQGEDVSMGIWLSAINPDFIEDENFECDTACSFKSYNRAQVSLNQVHEVWANFKKCKSLCTCPNSNIPFDTF